MQKLHIGNLQNKAKYYLSYTADKWWKTELYLIYDQNDCI